MRKQYYGFCINFDSDIAPGANGRKTVRIDTAGDFVVESIGLTIYTSGVVLTSTLSGTPFPRDGSASPGTTGNTLPTLALFRLQLFNPSGINWFSDPVRCNLLNGYGDAPHFLQTRPTVEAGSDVQATLYNDCAATFSAQGQILLEGYKLVS